jgi:hypothetical protein
VVGLGTVNVTEKYDELIIEAVPLINDNDTKINPKSGGIVNGQGDNREK